MAGYCRFSARFSTVSSAAFTVAYSSGGSVPAIFSLSSAKSSSLSASSRAVCLAAGEPAAGDAKSAVDQPAAAKPVAHKRSGSKRAANDEAAKKPDSTSTLSSFFRR